MPEPGDAKREAILEAALEVVAAKGYFETKVEDIAQKAGVAKGTVYLHFKDKPDIYIGLVERLFDQAVATIREIDARPLSARDKLVQVHTAWADYVFARPGAMGLLSAEEPPAQVESSAQDRLRPVMMSRMHELVSSLAAIVKQGIAVGEFRDVDPVAAALMFAISFRTSLVMTRHDLGVRNPRTAAFDILLNGVLRIHSEGTAQEST